jgi:hypothetical protein
MSGRAVLLLVLPVLALLLLAAHLLHAGLWLPATLALLLIGLLAVPRPWAARSLQVILALAVVEWVLTAVALAQIRASHGEPYARLLVILAAVAVFTAAAAAVFQHRLLRSRFGLGLPADSTRPTA